MNNRKKDFRDYASPDCNQDNKYDIVIGPVANDKMVTLFRRYENNFIDEQYLLREMTFRELTNQYSFHTPKAVALLKKVGVENGR